MLPWQSREQSRNKSSALDVSKPTATDDTESYHEQFKNVLPEKNLYKRNESQTSSEYITEAAETCGQMIVDNQQKDLISYLSGLQENVRIVDIKDD